MNEYLVSAEENEDDELPDASYHHNVGPVLLQYMGSTSTVSLSATCMFAICIAPVIRELVDESKMVPLLLNGFLAEKRILCRQTNMLLMRTHPAATDHRTRPS